MKSIALVTYKKSPNLSESDILLVEPFKKIGFSITSAPWDDKKIMWDKFEYVILRSCWDYHERIDEFYEWLDKLERLRVKVWNPLPSIRWNSNKKYLLDLEKKDIPIVPTTIINKNSTLTVESLFSTVNTHEIVIKPTVGASAYEIFRVKDTAINVGQEKIDRLLSKSDIIVQPLMKEVINQGEYSFMFFNKKFSHTMLRSPKKGDFRTNYHEGGIETKAQPSDNLIAQATHIVSGIDSPLLYARVDAIDCNGKLTLMELELIEPHLFFDQDSKSPDLFVRAFKELI